MQVQHNKIPPYLKTNGRFCNWKYEQRGGGQTKVPYIPGTTRRASVDDLSTFISPIGPPRSHGNIRGGKIFAEMVKCHSLPWLYIERHLARTDVTRGYRYADPH